jgi:hypothetical protein
MLLTSEEGYVGFTQKSKKYNNTGSQNQRATRQYYFPIDL